MFRPWQIWLAFGVCLAVVIAAVGWMSVRALEADNAEAAATRQAALESNAQLALWRMDSAMAPLVAQESARPYFTYESFYTVGHPAAASKSKATGGSANSIPTAGRMPAGGFAPFSDRSARSLLLAARSAGCAAIAGNSAVSERGGCGACSQDARPRSLADPAGRTVGLDSVARCLGDRTERRNRQRRRRQLCVHEFHRQRRSPIESDGRAAAGWAPTVDSARSAGSTTGAATAGPAAIRFATAGAATMVRAIERLICP